MAARSPIAALLLLLLSSPGASLLVGPGGPVMRASLAACPSERSSQRATHPQAMLLMPELATAASSAPDGNALAAVAPTLLLAGEDVFGEVFMAGMSIAFAALGTTVFVGILVNAKYDDIEKSFFDAQDDAIAESTAQSAKKAQGSQQVVSDFFGDVNPTEDTPKPEDP